MLYCTVYFFFKGIIDLECKGVYAAALIKKRRYWPKGVLGDLVDTHFEDKEDGDVETKAAS